MIEIRCDICGEKILTYNGGYEIRSMAAPNQPSIRHMCKDCFRVYVIRGKERDHDTVETD